MTSDNRKMPNLDLTNVKDSSVKSDVNNQTEEQVQEDLNTMPNDENNDVNDELIKKIDELKKQNADLEKKLLYIASEYDNSNKRHKKELEDANKFAITNFALEVVKVYDVLAVAIQQTDEKNTDITLYNGVKMTMTDFEKMFEKMNIQKIEPNVGDKFDHNKHEAISRAQSEVGLGNIVQVVRPGYELYGRLIRPAMVVVGA